MNRRKAGMYLVFVAVVLMTDLAHVVAQETRAPARPFAANVIVPQSRAFAVGRTGTVEITGVSVGVVILEQAASTTLEIALRNPRSSRLEAELIAPVPEGAVVRGFSFEGAASEPTARLLPHEEARRTYEAVVAKMRDPALLEFVGYNLIRSSVFPVPANGTQKVRLTYEHLLPADGHRIDYVLPRSESVDYMVPWKISVRIKSKQPIATVYSPSHRIETVRKSESIVSARVADDAATEPGPFRLSYLLEENGVTASLFAYPDASVGGGYFLLLAGLPARIPRAGDGPAIKREVTLVLDRSGSMRDEKIEQVREAALQVLAGLEKGEAFNIITYNESVDLFSKEPVSKTPSSLKSAREYLATVTASGGTNIYDALQEALRQGPSEGRLPIILFLTDGLATVGQTSEVAIRNLATKANPHNRRIFTFGVGVDVNTPLLEGIASETRAAATFVLPKEDVEVKVAEVFKRLAGPVLADPTLEVLDSSGEPDPGRVRDLIPARLPDLFDDDQLILTGKYAGQQPLTFRVSGNYLGSQRAFSFTFGVDKATTRNGFVARLWASRRVATLVDAIRRQGADRDPLAPAPVTDPRMKELVDEVVRLSTEFGILTEYTAFLAREGTDLSARDQVLAEANTNFARRALRARSGLGAMNQEFNNAALRQQSFLNARNAFFDQNMERVTITSVQQVGDRAFYRRGGRWLDSRIVGRESEVVPARVITFGSEEFCALARRLAVDGRQGTIALRGDILMVVDGAAVLIKGPTTTAD